MVRLSNALSARMRSAESERGVAMLSAIIFMIIMAGLSVVLVSVVLGQTVPAYIAQKSTQTINVAQSGMQATMGLFRSAASAPDASGNVYGNPAKLPCTVTGKVNAVSDGLQYSVTITYFLTDPTGQSASWIAANKMSCSSSSGLTDAPGYAIVLSTGAGSAIPGSASATTGNRTIQAIYKFKITTVNIPGGRIYDFANAYCLDADTATVGSLVHFLPNASCTNDSDELWIYDDDYEIKLASTVTTTNPGLCVTGPVVNGQPTQNATLQTCLTTAARWNELWAWIGGNAWQGQNQAIATGPSGYCLATGYSDGTNLNGKPLLVSTGCNGGFAPSAEVGAGAAGYTTHQIVNYDEFGRCADVTNEDLSSSFMISYPCKQDATGVGTYLLWNHKWFYSEPPTGQPSLGNQQIYVYYLDNSASKFCLQTPSATASPAYVTFQTCTSSAQQQWTRVQDNGSYATSYVFVDTFGRCLTADSTDVYAGNWSKIVMKTCSPALNQKWNAPASQSDSSVSSYREIAP
jgi:Ricin-type beta-trefoil lectin domain